MQNPDPELQKNQEKMLAELPPHLRAAQAQLLRIGNASMHYYAESESFDPSETDWKEWIEGLLEPARSSLRSKGFEACKSHLPFRRYVLEKNDRGMTEFMRTHLSAEDFDLYKSTTDKISGDQKQKPGRPGPRL